MDQASISSFGLQGIPTEFQAVIAIRQAHNFHFGNSDMFFLCMMEVKSKGLQPTFQESELVGAKWMPLNEFMGQEFISQRETMRTMLERYFN